MPPPPVGPVRLRRRSILPNPFEGGPSKTGIFAESLVSENVELKWVDGELALRRRQGSLDATSTDLTYPSVSASSTPRLQHFILGPSAH